ncbi:MAG: hypothetical protein JWR04_2761 [Rhodoglobus sp.]|nr:hypothetical protein [Rhodoglobus sp.]
MLLVEVHIPLSLPKELEEGEEPFPWIDEVSEFLAELEDDPAAEGAAQYEDGEEFGDNYVFFLHGASEASLLAAATRIARMPGVPAGAFAMVTDTDAAEFGLGTRVDLD